MQKKKKNIKSVVVVFSSSASMLKMATRLLVERQELEKQLRYNPIELARGHGKTARSCSEHHANSGAPVSIHDHMGAASKSYMSDQEQLEESS